MFATRVTLTTNINRAFSASASALTNKIFNGIISKQCTKLKCSFLQLEPFPSEICCMTPENCSILTIVPINQNSTPAEYDYNDNCIVLKSKVRENRKKNRIIVRRISPR